MFAAAAVFYAMLGCRRGRLLMVLSTLGLSRSYVMPRLGGRLAHCIRPARPSNTRLYRRSRGTSSRTDGSFEDGDSSSDEWNTWEFGTWKTRTHAENMAEAVARASEPASVPALIGGGAGLAGQTSADLDRAIGVLEGFLTDERMARMQDVLDQRTGSSTMVFENPANPNNVWACLRTLDSFGIQNAHIVADPATYSKKARLKTMCTAMGSQKWLTLHGHDSPEDAVNKLKREGFQVVASDLSPSAVPIGDIDWSVPTAVVLGNEERGISDSMRKMADATFAIPMRGFVQSFNMSVACSVILAHLSAVRALRHGDLSEDERRKVKAAWLMQCVRGSDHILAREGIVIPDQVIGTKGGCSQNVAGYHAR